MKKGNTTVEAGKDRNIASSGSVDDWKNKKEDHNCKHDPMNTQSDNVTLKVRLKSISLHQDSISQNRNSIIVHLKFIESSGYFIGSFI